jgi:hypothetical protein
LHLFSFFNAHDSQVWSFDGVASSCIFPSQLLCCLTIYSVFCLISILSLSPEILSSTCSTLLEWLSTVFFVWLKGLFISRTSDLILLSEVFHIFVQLLFYVFCCHL